MKNKTKENIMTYKPKTLTVKISTVRDMTYKKIDALVKDIKEPVDHPANAIEELAIRERHAYLALLFLRPALLLLRFLLLRLF